MSARSDKLDMDKVAQSVVEWFTGAQDGGGEEENRLLPQWDGSHLQNLVIYIYIYAVCACAHL